MAMRQLALGALAVLAIGSAAEAGIGMQAPDIRNDTWLNGRPVSFAELKGKVVMVEFWTFGCYNCRNVEPYVREWHRKYKDRGFVVIGVHSPEFSYEKDVEKVKKYVRDHGIDYAVPIDNEFATWNRYGNRYWPAMYLIDKKGVIRSVQIGEGRYQETEKLIQSLLSEPS
jgi:thiol-disulfide isomerase/thioredoxin